MLFGWQYLLFRSIYYSVCLIASSIPVCSDHLIRSKDVHLLLIFFLSSHFKYYFVKFMQLLILSLFSADPINRPTYSSTAQVEPRHVIYCCLVFSAFYGTSLLSWPQGPQIKSGHHIGAGRSLLSYEEQTCMVYFGQSGDCMFTVSRICTKCALYEVSFSQFEASTLKVVTSCLVAFEQ